MSSLITCKVHPVVILSIIDAFERRDAKEGSNKKAIGTLLGNFERNVVEVSNCYCVPHSEVNGEAKISPHINKEMYELSKISNSTEVAVGWFSTASEISESSLLYHDFYVSFVQGNATSREALPVVHLTLDTSLSGARLGIKAYIQTKINVPSRNPKPQCSMFVPIDVDIIAYEPEKVGLSTIMGCTENPKRLAQLTSGVEQLKKSVDDMSMWIEKLQKYVDEVLAGKKQPDNAVGRRLNELVSNVAQLQPGQFDAMLNASIKDFLMVSYLAELAKTELTLHEKLVSL